ncbi:ubiquitin-like modifier hub1 [Conoideocrella luteorostrata]|uniref:Ubiquitin-like modifier HUB1 n=1 Tax=Conoideocrella luteorostrata TaxID=1105319 RepID=A0AAJ0FY18_9HYPO|nr:ubiquitin-like modifier hub1 [Conoideocrella luteorostrata]
MADKPSRGSRSRSHSPPRRPRSHRGGFRWKDNSRRNDNRDDPGRRRDFRERSQDRNKGPDSYQGRGRDGDRDRNMDRLGERHRNSDRDRNRDHDKDRRGSERLRSPRRDDRRSRDKGDGKKEEKGKVVAVAPAAGGGEEMIIVNVNDRLGSKSAVPCLPSDTVGQFKIMVAARIGREPSQIMLRRQGERPFKDHITLEDYGISNGVQLDLEIDTGD